MYKTSVKVELPVKVSVSSTKDDMSLLMKFDQIRVAYK